MMATTLDAVGSEMPAPLEIRSRAPMASGVSRRVARAARSLLHQVFGLVSVLVGLAVLASIPLVQFVSLGYLLEVAGRIARTGQLRSGLIGLDKAARLGGAALGTLVCWAPLVLLNHLNYVAMLVDEHGAVAGQMRQLSVVLLAVLTFHVAVAWYAGARLRDFLWPMMLPVLGWRLLRRRRPTGLAAAPVEFLLAVGQGRLYGEARDALWNIWAGLRLPYYFWLGFRGFLGGLIWLIVPVSLLVAAIRNPTDAAPLIGLVGGFLLVLALLYLPFLQAQFAADGQWRALFQVRRVRKCFGRAPLAFLMALAAALVLATPLYLLKIEYTPQEIAWLPSLVFVVFGLPARFIAGWAVARSQRRDRPRHFVWRWGARCGMLAVATLYVGIAFFTQYASWYGSWSLLEQHAFLVPVPFMGGP